MLKYITLSGPGDIILLFCERSAALRCAQGRRRLRVQTITPTLRSRFVVVVVVFGILPGSSHVVLLIVSTYNMPSDKNIIVDRNRTTNFQSLSYIPIYALIYTDFIFYIIFICVCIYTLSLCKAAAAVAVRPTSLPVVSFIWCIAIRRNRS